MIGMSSSMMALVLEKLILFFFLFFYWEGGLQLQHMEVPRLGVKSELQLPATTTATWVPSCICDLHYSSWQCWILNPLREARDQSHSLMDHKFVNGWATKGTPIFSFYSHTSGICKFWGSGWNWSCSCWPMPQLQQCQIQAAPVTYITAHGNARSLTCYTTRELQI